MNSDEISNVRVWLIEDNDAFRSVIQRVLNDLEGIECTRAFADCEAALAAFSEGAPEVVLLDVGLPGMNGIAGIRQIRSRAPETLVIMLTVFDEPEKISEAIRAGASGYLLKTASEEKIAEAVKQVMEGEIAMDDTVAQRVWKLLADTGNGAGKYRLTLREQEILRAMVDGRTNKEIAAQLAMSYHTVDTHVRRIFGKLQLHTRAAVVARAVQEHLV